MTRVCVICWLSFCNGTFGVQISRGQNRDVTHQNKSDITDSDSSRKILEMPLRKRKSKSRRSDSSQQLDQETRKEDQETEECLRKFLNPMESSIMKIQSVLVWEDPRYSTAMLVVANVLFWYAVVIQVLNVVCLYIQMFTILLTCTNIIVCFLSVFFVNFTGWPPGCAFTTCWV